MIITGELKNKIDSLWEIFWTGGLTNPLDVIEQMTYMMFIRDLDDSDNMHAKEAAMLGLPYKSIFAGEVKIGERSIDGNQFECLKLVEDVPALFQMVFYLDPLMLISRLEKNSLKIIA